MSTPNRKSKKKKSPSKSGVTSPNGVNSPSNQYHKECVWAEFSFSLQKVFNDKRLHKTEAIFGLSTDDLKKFGFLQNELCVLHVKEEGTFTEKSGSQPLPIQSLPQLAGRVKAVGGLSRGFVALPAFWQPVLGGSQRVILEKVHQSLYKLAPAAAVRLVALAPSGSPSGCRAGAAAATAALGGPRARRLLAAACRSAVAGEPVVPAGRGARAAASFEGVPWAFQIQDFRLPESYPGMPNATNGAKVLYRITSETKLEIELPQDPEDADGEHTNDSPPEDIQEDRLVTSDKGWEDVGGLQKEIQLIRDTIELPLTQPELFEAHGVRAPKGVLLHGPPGTGKTSLCRAAARALAPCHVIGCAGPDLVSKYAGESEQALKRIFEEAEQNQPCLIIMDEIDALCMKREDASSTVEKSMVSTLLALMDGIHTAKQVAVLACTNRPDALDPAVRRPGRLDREVEVGPPGEPQRAAVLRVLLRGLRNSVGPGAIAAIAKRAHGFVGADLALVVKGAALAAAARRLRGGPPPPPGGGAEGEQPSGGPEVTEDDLLAAYAKVRPSQLREVAVEVPAVRWADIGGMDAVKQELKEVAEWPLQHPEAFERMGISPPKGVLLYGPPGCSKTLMARALATESGMNFLAVKGPELLSKWLGESERALQSMFKRARAAAPTIIFFDEIDAIATRRGGAEGAGATERVLTQLLTELDGVRPLRRVVVVAATNRPDLLDPALCRPGRLDRLVYVPPPDPPSRRAILALALGATPAAADVDAEALAARTGGYSGAEIVAVVKEAALAALEEDADAQKVASRHLETAMRRKTPQITQEMLDFYSTFRVSTMR